MERIQRLLLWLIGVPAAAMAWVGIVVMYLGYEQIGLTIFTISLCAFLLWFFGSWIFASCRSTHQRT